MLSLNNIAHTAGARSKWTLDYRGWLAPGEVLSSYTLVSSSDTLLVDTDSISQGKRLLFRLTDGEAGETATITATVTTSFSERKIEELTVRVNAP